MSRYRLLKVKTGCETCRQRKVKCDEARPTCQRCRNASRNCLGYAASVSDQQGKTSTKHASSSVRQAIARAPSIFSAWGLNEQEQRAFSNYQVLGYATIPFSRDCREYWGPVLLRSCHRSRGILHGVIAFSLLYDGFNDVTKVKHASPAKTNAVLHHEMLAYRSMKQCEDVLEVVHAASLFASIAYAVGEHTAAVRHILHGIVLVDTMGFKAGKSAETELPPCHERFGDMGATFRICLDVVCPVVGRNSESDGGYKDKLDTWSWWLMVTGFCTRGSAGSHNCQRMLDGTPLYQSIYNFVLEADQQWGRGYDRSLAKLQGRQTALLSQLECCLEEFRPDDRVEGMLDITQAEIRLRHIIWKVCLSSCLTQTLHAPEDTIGIFQEMVKLAEEMREGQRLRSLLVMIVNLLALLKWPPARTEKIAPESLWEDDVRGLSLTGDEGVQLYSAADFATAAYEEEVDREAQLCSGWDTLSLTRPVPVLRYDPIGTLGRALLAA